MLYQWDQCQALCCCLLGEEQWFRRFQKLEQIVSSADTLLSSLTDICFLVPPICGPSSSAISWVAAVPMLFYSHTLRFVNDHRYVTNISNIFFFVLKWRRTWHWVNDHKNVNCPFNKCKKLKKKKELRCMVKKKQTNKKTNTND